MAEPIKEAVRAAVAISDTGYADKGDLGEAFAAFAGQRLRWSPDPSRIFAIPDLMTCIAEIIMAVTPPGSGAEHVPFLSLGHEATRRAITWTARRSGSATILPRRRSPDAYSRYFR